MTTRSEDPPRTVLQRWHGIPPVAAAGCVAVLMLLGGGLALVVVEPFAVLPLFALLVVVAAVRFGARWGGTTGLAAGLLGGPAASPVGEAAGVVVTAAVVVTLVLVGVTVGALSSAGAAGSARDRDLRQREHQLAQQRAALVQVVSHELRTPLTVIRGGLDTLRDRPEAVAPDYRELLGATDRSASRLEELLDVVLAAADELGDGSAGDSSTEHDRDVAPSGRVPGEAVGVRLAPLVRDAAASIHGGLNGRLDLQLDEHAMVVTVEPELWLTLRCLLDNAAKFGPPDDRIEVGFETDGGDAVVVVRDHGPGLPDGFEEAAFAPFTPGDTSLVRPHAGLGMGLYTARRLARRLGGDVEVVSGRHGFEARVRLPQPASPPDDGPVVTRSNGPDRTSGRLVG